MLIFQLAIFWLMLIHIKKSSLICSLSTLCDNLFMTWIYARNNLIIAIGSSFPATNHKCNRGHYLKQENQQEIRCNYKFYCYFIPRLDMQRNFPRKNRKRQQSSKWKHVFCSFRHSDKKNQKEICVINNLVKNFLRNPRRGGNCDRDMIVI